MNELVSIIMPSYNTARSIATTSGSGATEKMRYWMVLTPTRIAKAVRSW